MARQPVKPGLWKRIDVIAGKATPFAVTFLLVLINTVPTGLPGWSQINPVLPLIAVYHWSVHRPDLLGGTLVLVIGLIHDVLNGLPLGLHALVFLTVHGIVVFKRRYLVGKSFPLQWTGFVIAALGAAALSWILGSIHAFHLIGPDPLVYQYLVTIGLYPAVAWFLIRWQHSFLQIE